MRIEFLDARNTQTEPHITGDANTVNFALALNMDARERKSGAYPSFHEKLLPCGIERTFSDGTKIRMHGDG